MLPSLKLLKGSKYTKENRFSEMGLDYSASQLFSFFYVPPHSGNEYSPFGIEVMPSAGQRDGHHNIWSKINASVRLASSTSSTMFSDLYNIVLTL